MVDLGMFAKYPSPGATKTRLAQTLGADLAAEFSRAFLLDQLDRLPDLADRFLLCATPDSDVSRSWFNECLPPSAALHFQPEVSFGERIDWFFQTAFQNDAELAILVGSDSPDLPAPLILNAAKLLKRNEVVFCPSTDGGYTLIGMNSLHQGLFGSVSFSSRLTLNESLEAVREAGLSCELLSPWYDIDEIHDLCLLWSRIQVDSAVRQMCPRSSHLLERSWGQIATFLKKMD